MKFCTNCGSQLSDGANFCTNCGTTQVAQSQQVKESTVKKVIASCKSKLMANNRAKLLPFAIGALVLIIIGVFFFKGDENNLGILKPECFRIYEKGKWGLINNKGKVVIKPKYDDIENMYNGLAAVEVDGKWGYINSKGELVIKPVFYKAGPFNHGAAPAVTKDFKWGLVNKKGEFIELSEYEYIEPVMEGLALVKKDGKYGYINTKGKLVIDTKYDSATSFLNGYAVVEEEGDTFYINKKGKNKFKKTFRTAKPFSEGLAFVRTEGSYFYSGGAYINTKGKIVFQTIDSGQFSNGLAPVYDSKQGKYGYINKKGKFKIKAQFEEASVFSDGLAIIEEDGEYGYINKKGKVVIKPGFERAEPFLNGLAYVRTEDGWGYINKKGKMIWQYKE